MFARLQSYNALFQTPFFETDQYQPFDEYRRLKVPLFVVLQIDVITVCRCVSNTVFLLNCFIFVSADRHHSLFYTKDLLIYC